MGCVKLDDRVANLMSSLAIYTYLLCVDKYQPSYHQITRRISSKQVATSCQVPFNAEQYCLINRPTVSQQQFLILFPSLLHCYHETSQRRETCFVYGQPTFLHKFYFLIFPFRLRLYYHGLRMCMFFCRFCCCCFYVWTEVSWSNNPRTV